MRRLAARGVLINGAFDVGLTSLGLIKGFVVSLTIVGNALQTPIWPHYRSMHFARQRSLQAIDPIVAFVVTVVLAASGAGYWSLVIGVVAGAFAGALAAIVASPFPLRLRWDPAVARSYVSFSWPLLVAGTAGIVISQSAVLVSEFSLGLAGVGAVALASSIVAYTGRVDQIVTNTLYPAICRVVDRREALVEAFVKSNRLALSFGLPFGVGLALFAEPLIVDGLGPRWEPAVELVQVFALVAAADQVFFNWTAFHRALGRTRPIAVVNVVMAVVFVGVAIPLLLAEGLTGLGIGMGVTCLAGLVLRGFYVRQLFGPIGLAPLVVRSAFPAGLGAALVLLSSAPLGAELAVYLVAVTIATLGLQGGLLREAAGYLARRSSAQSEPATRPA